MFAKVSNTQTILFVAGALFLSTNVYAQETTEVERPKILEDLIKCDAITKDKDRLACYDKNIATFKTAEETGEILVADREVVDKAREDIFGLKVSDNPLFNGKNGANINEITSIITSARRLKRSNKWVFTLENGSTWQQTDTKNLRRGAKEGFDVVIEKASFGGFNAKIKGQKFIKVKRIR